MAFSDNLFSYIQDVNNYLSGVSGRTIINTVSQIAIDSRASASFGTVAASKRTFKPFIVGFIPPDVLVNFIPIDIVNKNIATVTGSTAKGLSASTGVASKSSPLELKPTVTKFNQRDLGDALYNSLRNKGLSDADAAHLVPLMVGQVSSEITHNNGIFSTKNYNIGNMHSSSPGSYNDPSNPKSGIKDAPPIPNGGTFVLGTDTFGKNQTIPEGAKVGDKYPVYFQASNSLQESTDKWVSDTTGKWPGVLTASNPQDYTQALLSEKQGGSGKVGSYFTSDPTDYARNLAFGQNAYLRETGGIVTPSSGEIVQNAVSSTEKLSINVMAPGSITDFETEDPLGFVAGRNIRVTQDQDRARIVALQVAQLNTQIKSIQSIPPLSTLINPQEFTRSYEHSIDTPKARRGHIIHMWLEKPMIIACKGVTAASYVFNEVGDGGLSNKYRVRSLSYRNLISLVRIYKNNGFIYTGNAFGDQNGNIPFLTMSIFIYYDGHLYIGSFDDFNITDEAEKPFNFQYNFRFTVRYDIESSVSDGQLSGLVPF